MIKFNEKKIKLWSNIGIRASFGNLMQEICEKKNGFLHSVDIDDCSKVANSNNWKFHQSRDDNFKYLDAPIQIVGSVDTPAIPLNSELELTLLPNAEKVSEAIDRLIKF